MELGVNYDLLILGITVAGIAILGFFIYFNDSKSVTNVSFLKFSLATACWGVFNYLNYNTDDQRLVLWFIKIVMFFAIFQSYYFFKLMYVFPEKEVKLPKFVNKFLFNIVSLVALFTLTPYVFSTVTKRADSLVYQPKAEFGIVIFAFVAVSLVASGFYFLKIKYNKITDPIQRKQFFLIFLGNITMFSLILFFNFTLSLFFENTRFIPYGAVFILPFIILTSYAIYKHKLFNIKIASVGFIAFILTIFSFFNILYTKSVSQVVLNITFFILILIGSITLIKTILREVEQKEYLQVLNSELRDLLKQRESLVHLITHKVKGSFTRSKYIFAEMVEGSFGELHDPLLSMAKKGLSSDNEGIQTVDLVLNSFNLSSGTVKYDMKQISFKDIVNQVISEKKSRAEDKGLNIETEMNLEDSYNILGDAFWIKEVVNNFIENSIRYSLTGTIHIKLEKKDHKIVLSVKDNGVGLTDEDKKNLFTEGGRGKDSIRMNIDSTGYGLFSVKLIVQAHKGRVWAESEGKDKGSTFFVELDESPSN